MINHEFNNTDVDDLNLYENRFTYRVTNHELNHNMAEMKTNNSTRS